MKSTITWLRKSLEGKDGVASARRITAFWFVVLATIIVFSMVIIIYRAAFFKEHINADVLKAMEYMQDALVTISGMILLLFGVTTVQNVASIVKGKETKEDDRA